MPEIKPLVEELTFGTLVSSIRKTHDLFLTQASKAVNVNLTMRNWVIGYYIERYERSGVDRAKYGEKLMDDLSDSLKNQGLPRCDRRELYRYRKFYLTYPYLVEELATQFAIGDKSHQTVFSLIPNFEKSIKIVETVSPQLRNDGQKLLSSLSFSHFTEILDLDDPLKRVFYEVECIRGGWSVRELRRQISTLYYERSGLSTDKNKLAARVQSKAEKVESGLTIRDPYVFEFLGLNSNEVMDESDVEKALLDKLQEFLLELGHGFCFEARQKRILIGSRHFFVDLVFYHRVIKCHVLIELKVDEFTHEHLGQLNTYVSWFKKNVMLEGDNPPIGILLCTQKDYPLVEYALAGMDNNLFVSKYLLELPKKEEMQKFIEEQMKEVKK